MQEIALVGPAMGPLQRRSGYRLAIFVSDPQGLVSGQLRRRVGGKNDVTLLGIQECLEGLVALGMGIGGLVDVEFGGAKHLFDVVASRAPSAALAYLPSIDAEVA